MKYFLGIDIGTYESKGMLVDENGQCIAVAAKTHEMLSPYLGYAEHDAQSSWWGDFCFLCKELLWKTKINAADIKGVGASTIGPCLLTVDSANQPLRNAILYGIDVRAKEEIDILTRRLGEEWVLQRYGNPITSQSIGPKLMWLRKHEPDIYQKSHKFLTGTSFLVAKLTGNYVIDRYTAAYFTPMYNLHEGDWDYGHLADFCRPEQLPSCLWSTEIAGNITSEAALETGLIEGTPVITGTADAAADAVGVGAFNAGDMLVMFGSSIFMIHVVPKLTVDKRFWSGPYLFKDTYMMAAGMSTAGTLTRWFKDQLATDLVQKAEQCGENIFALLKEESLDVPPGSLGLVVLPYWSGERTPINDPQARGVIFGLNLQHQRKHIYQACLEGIGYGIGQHFDCLREIGVHTSQVIAVGGGTLNEKWMQIVASIIGGELKIGQTFGAAYGDALLAALGVGHYRSVEELQTKIHFEHSVSPVAEHQVVYQNYKTIYTKIYNQTKELMHAL